MKKFGIYQILHNQQNKIQQNKPEANPFAVLNELMQAQNQTPAQTSVQTYYNVDQYHNGLNEQEDQINEKRTKSPFQQEYFKAFDTSLPLYPQPFVDDKNKSS